MAAGNAKYPNTIDLIIGAEDTGSGFDYHIVDPDTGAKTKFADGMWARYPDGHLSWWVDNSCDHEIEVRIDLQTGSPKPPTHPGTPPPRTIKSDKGRLFTAVVRAGAWPPWGTEDHEYRIEVRTAGGTVWQRLDPQLQLERPFGFYSSQILWAVVAGATGAAVVLLAQAFGWFR